MIKAFLLSIRILIFGFLLPFQIWKFSKEKVLNIGRNPIRSILDEEYVVTSWLDLVIDSIIFLLYPIGCLIVLLVCVFTNIRFIHGAYALIPLYLLPLIFSFIRELGGSFMLLHMNVKRIRKILEN